MQFLFFFYHKWISVILNFKNIKLFLVYIMKYIFNTLKIKHKNLNKSVSNISDSLIFNNHKYSITNVENYIKTIILFINNFYTISF